MWRTASERFIVVALAILLGGCGLTQKIVEGTASTAHAVFYKQVKTLHLDFTGRSAMNTDSAEMSGLSVPVLVRVYQLRNHKALDRATYDDLVSHGERVLGDDLLNEKAVVVKPGEAAQLTTPLSSEAQYIAVIALFRNPDMDENTWRLTVQRDDLDPDQPRVVELGDNRLKLRPPTED
ncbi:type VI secretion system lipoprotein TssJ [Pseudomonas fulva]|uniref:type VI secretion system lipoprotein TssJ n=1 Tax=Pseudomonas putida group TaxID=136845 RepID=UPI0018A921AC|nr:MULTISPECIES: type VI secretion system lipoprotein TssJ [Pseudomonas putida group]MBF8675051.1 type VI secretion system lipoprotein TssJ [Pseudomonas fulva]MBF8696389.1 type VI secretion system lipoprotein TssJ [Pseudomonas fulva]MBI6923695.1 type VI secretion system lipoprotein TssJ [Pseudomonas putida]